MSWCVAATKGWRGQLDKYLPLHEIRILELELVLPLVHSASCPIIDYQNNVNAIIIYLLSANSDARLPALMLLIILLFSSQGCDEAVIREHNLVHPIQDKFCEVVDIGSNLPGWWSRGTQLVANDSAAVVTLGAREICLGHHLKWPILKNWEGASSQHFIEHSLEGSLELAILGIGVPALAIVAVVSLGLGGTANHNRDGSLVCSHVD